MMATEAENHPAKRALNEATPTFAEVTKVFRFVETDEVGADGEKGKWEELAKGTVRFAKMTTGRTRLQLINSTADASSSKGYKLNMAVQETTPLQHVNDRHVYVSCPERRDLA